MVEETDHGGDNEPYCSAYRQHDEQPLPSKAGDETEACDPAPDQAGPTAVVLPNPLQRPHRSTIPAWDLG